MKIINVTRQTAAALIVAVIAFAGCAGDPAITMTTAIEGELKFWIAGTGRAIIDWGDGSAPETVTLSAYDGYVADSQLYAHAFPDTTSRTITIEGQNITHLDCGGLQLTTLDVSKNTALTCLYCSNNPLPALDVSKNIALTDLDCYGNRLTDLDVGKNTGLKELNCYGNRLTSLDMSKNTGLTYLVCGDNRLTAEGLNALFGTLPGNASDKEINIAGNPGTAACDISIARDKGWEVNY